MNGNRFRILEEISRNSAHKPEDNTIYALKNKFGMNFSTVKIILDSFRDNDLISSERPTVAEVEVRKSINSRGKKPQYITLLGDKILEITKSVEDQDFERDELVRTHGENFVQIAMKAGVLVKHRKPKLLLVQGDILASPISSRLSRPRELREVVYIARDGASHPDCTVENS